MTKAYDDLVSTKITASTKAKLQFIKSQYLPPIGKSDYAALAHLVEQEYLRCRAALANQA